MKYRREQLFSLCVTFLLLVQSQGLAQTPPDITWQRTLGGTSPEDSRSIDLTADGGYVVVGRAESSDGDVTTSLQDDNFWVVKLDAAGTVVWSKTPGGSGNEFAYSVQQTSDGGYIVAGWTSSTDGDVTGKHAGANNDDCWVVKLDASGNIAWAKCYGGSDFDIASCIRQTSDGGYIMAGWSNSSDGDLTSNKGGHDFWAVKLDAQGAITWQKSLGGSGDDVCESVRQTTDGGYILAGYTLSSDGDVTGYHGGTNVGDCWVVKLDGNGTLVWQKCFGGSADDAASAIRQTGDGGYIMGATTVSSNGDVTGSRNSFDEWLVKMDANGNLQWQKTYGGPSLDEILDLQITADGGFVTSGVTFNNGGNVTGHHSAQDVWIVKTDNLGTLQWEQCYGGSSEEVGWSIQQTPDGYYVFTGEAYSNDGDVYGLHGASSDFWVVKLGAPVLTPIISSVQQKNIAGLICATSVLDSLWVHNTGNATLTISSASFVGATAGEFSFSPPLNFPVTIAAADSIKIYFKLTSTSSGNKMDTLALVSDDAKPGHSPWKIALAGKKDVVTCSVPSDVVIGFLHSGKTLDTSVVFTTTGTLSDTIKSIQRISGVAWISSVNPALPLAVLPPAPNNTAPIQFHILAPRDTGWFTAQFRVHVEPCSIDTVITIRVYVAGGILAEPSTLALPGLLCDAEQCDSTVLHNTGNASLVIASAFVHSGDSLWFIRLTPSFPLTLSPHDSVTVHVCFHAVPGKTGTRSSAVAVRSDDSISASGIKQISLMGTKDSSDIRLSTLSLDLGDVCLGQQGCGQVFVIPTGTVGDTIRVIPQTPDSTPITLTSPLQQVFCLAGGQAALTVCFSPTQVGRFTDTFLVQAQPCGRSALFEVHGRGTWFAVQPTETVIDFGVVPANQQRFRSTKIVVSGTGNLPVNGIATAPAGSNIVVDSTLPRLPYTFQQRDSLLVFFHFLPRSDESDSVRIDLLIGSVCLSSHEIIVKGKGVTGSLALDKSAINDGAFLCGNLTRTDTVNVINTGSINLTIDETIVGTDSSAFTLVPPTHFTLAPGASQDVYIISAPIRVGTSSATLLFSSDDASSGHGPLRVDLTGTRDSVGWKLAGAIADTLDLGSVLPGKMLDGTMTLLNYSTFGAAYVLRLNNVNKFSLPIKRITFPSQGGQQNFSIHFAGAATLGKYFSTLYVTDTCGRTDSVFVVVRVDSLAIDNVSIDISTLRDTTICPTDSAVRTVVLHNTGKTAQTLQCSTIDPSATVLPTIVTIAPGDSVRVTILFHGSPVIGLFNLIFSFDDSRGGKHPVSASIRIDTASITADPVPAVIVCPNTPIGVNVRLHNISTVAQRVYLMGTNALFVATPSSLSIASGADTTVKVMFAGASDTGTYTVLYGLPGCGTANAIAMRVRIAAPDIHVPGPLTAMLCPNTALHFVIPITNRGAGSQSLAFTAMNCTITKQQLLLLPSQTDSVEGDFAGGSVGTYNGVVHIVDTCNIDHPWTMVVTVSDLPPLALSLRMDTAAILVGSEKKIFLIASPSSALSNFTCVISNEATALYLDSVVTDLDMSAQRGNNFLTLSVQGGQQSLSDTVAVLYYHTLVGSTLAPYVILNNVSTVNTCQSVTGVDSTSFALLPGGCELGTVLVHPFTTTLQSVYPNPATGTTTVQYATIEESNVRIEISDMMGRVIHTVVDGMHKPGEYSVALDTRSYPSGIYVVNMREGVFSAGRLLRVCR